MAKYTNVVRFLVKEGQQEALKVGLARRVLGKGCCSTSSQKQVNGLMWDTGYGKVKKRW